MGTAPEPRADAQRNRCALIVATREAIAARGLEVWYDDTTLAVGDSLRRSIDAGLVASRFGVVILSPHFFAKNWPQVGLDGLTAKANATGSKVVLPIWHRLTRDEILRHSPTVADIIALNTAVMGLEEIADKLAAAVQGLTPGSPD